MRTLCVVLLIAGCNSSAAPVVPPTNLAPVVAAVPDVATVTPVTAKLYLPMTFAEVSRLTTGGYELTTARETETGKEWVFTSPLGLIVNVKGDSDLRLTEITIFSRVDARISELMMLTSLLSVFEKGSSIPAAVNEWIQASPPPASTVIQGLDIRCTLEQGVTVIRIAPHAVQ